MATPSVRHVWPSFGDSVSLVVSSFVVPGITFHQLCFLPHPLPSGFGFRPFCCFLCFVPFSCPVSPCFLLPLSRPCVSAFPAPVSALGLLRPPEMPCATHSGAGGGGKPRADTTAAKTETQGQEGGSKRHGGTGHAKGTREQQEPRTSGSEKRRGRKNRRGAEGGNKARSATHGVFFPPGLSLALPFQIAFWPSLCAFGLFISPSFSWGFSLLAPFFDAGPRTSLFFFHFIHSSLPENTLEPATMRSSFSPGIRIFSLSLPSAHMGWLQNRTTSATSLNGGI